MLKVVRWWLASLWANFGEPFVSSGNSVKKPYNPILGEQLHCRWEDSNPDSDWKTVVMTAEQGSVCSALITQPPTTINSITPSSRERLLL